MLLWLKPRGFDYLLDKFMPKDQRLYYQFLHQCVSERLQLRKKSHNIGQELRKDMFHYLCEAQDPDTGKPAYPEVELFAEANLLMHAGSDTTATSLSGFFFYITRDSRVYGKLTDEIRTTFASADEIAQGPKLTSCHYLRACIDEALRLTPAVPSELSRVVLSGGLQLEGDFLPEGVTVGAAHWPSGHSEANFADPSIFRPERWIVDDNAGNTAANVALARSSFHPFSAGPANCVGQNLAMLEMTLVIAKTLFRMDVRKVDGNSVGEGSPELGWGRHDKNVFQIEDAYVAAQSGPVVQFRRRNL